MAATRLATEAAALGFREILLTDFSFPTEGSLDKIAVDPACRRQGVGRALLAAGEAWARSQGAEAMRLVSGESRKGAYAFYASLGYTGNKLQRNFKKNLTQEGP